MIFLQKKKENLKSLHTENENVTYTHIYTYSQSIVALKSNDTKREHSEDDKNHETHILYFTTNILNTKINVSLGFLNTTV